MKIDLNGNSWIYISEFYQQTYCEKQLKFIWQGLERKTDGMINGSLVHERKYNNFIEENKDKERTNIKNAIERAIKNKERFIGREVFIISPTFRLIGKIDYIEIGPEGVIITDDKPSYNFNECDINQLLAYAIAFKDLYGSKLGVTTIIRNRDKGFEVWKSVLTEDDIIFMIEKIKRIHDLALGKIEFEPTKDHKKCLRCQYKDICDSSQQLTVNSSTDLLNKRSTIL